MLLEEALTLQAMDQTAGAWPLSQGAWVLKGDGQFPILLPIYSVGHFMVDRWPTPWFA
jgi:hypothetical protein